MKLAKVREIGVALPKETNHRETKAMRRRIKHQSTLACFATGLIGFLSARSMVNLPLLSRKKKGKKRKGGSLQQPSYAIQLKMEEQISGRIYVETEVRRKKLQATIDTGAHTVYMAKVLADKSCLPYKKGIGYVKGAKAKSLPILGVANGADI